jgi:hypothetical protein
MPFYLFLTIYAVLAMALLLVVGLMVQRLRLRQPKPSDEKPTTARRALKQRVPRLRAAQDAAPETSQSADETGVEPQVLSRGFGRRVEPPRPHPLRQSIEKSPPPRSSSGRPPDATRLTAK